MEFRREKNQQGWWVVAVCPEVNLSGQGRTVAQARDALCEAFMAEVHLVALMNRNLNMATTDDHE